MLATQIGMEAQYFPGRTVLQGALLLLKLLPKLNMTYSHGYCSYIN